MAKAKFEGIRFELEALLKTKQKSSEADEAYAKRLAQSTNKVAEEDWESQLHETTQRWVNDQLEAIENGKPVASLPSGEKEVGSGKPSSAKDPKDEKGSAEETEGTEKADAGKAEANAESDVKNGKSNSKKKLTTKTKAAAKAGGGKRGRAGPYKDDAKITILAKANPKRAGTATAKQFAKLKNGMTVAEARGVGFSAKSLKWDASHGYIAVK